MPADTSSSMILINSLPNESLYVFPNPVQSELYVHQSKNDVQSIVLIDQLGKRIPVTFSINNNLIHIELKGIAAGVYYLHCIGIRQNITKKIIVQ
jgi:hypothetical protein